ncbi:MAG: DUF4328 domain-containing protein [Actinomycetota bacterium]
MPNFCPQCGTPRPEGASFCGNCGRALGGWTEPAPAPTPASSWSAPGAPPPPPPTGSPDASHQPPVYAWSPPAMYAAPVVPPASRTLAQWIQVMAGIAAALYAFVLLASIAARSAFDDLVGGNLFTDDQEFQDADDVLSATRVLAFLSVSTLVILLIVWLYQVARSAARHNAVGRRWSPGWAVGGWFIPLANMVIPWLVFRENEKIAHSAAVGRIPMWPHAPLPLTSNLWWVLVVSGQVMLLAGGAQYGDEFADASQVRSGATFIAIGAVALAVGSILVIPVVRRISRFDAAPAPTPPPA